MITRIVININITISLILTLFIQYSVIRYIRRILCDRDIRYDRERMGSGGRRMFSLYEGMYVQPAVG